MPSLPIIRSALDRNRPQLLSTEGKGQAAVAMVLRERAGGPELLFIERAEHPDDPWSGHMAFPGGRVDAGDAGPRQAAERETREEVGVALAGAEPLGRLDDLEGRHAGRPSNLLISAFVYHHPRPDALNLNHEVREALWIPVGDLLDPSRHVDHQPRRPAMAMRFPGIVVGDPERHVVWGLTYRFLEMFLEVIGHPLPNRWANLPERLQASE